MSKYIDADRLRAEIESIRWFPQVSSNYNDGREDMKVMVFDIIDSLQQEQPSPSCRTCGFYENNCPFIRGKFIPYPNKVCKDYTYSAMKEQEQPEVDLEQEVDNYIENERYFPDDERDIVLEIARHFYELGVNTAKKESK